MTEMDGKTPDIAQENIEQLQQLFPDAFEEGKVDFAKLKQVLGDYVDDATERYNFTWNGKGRALRLAQSPSTGTLRPCKEESKDWDTTQNLYIEGDNLEVLKLLQKSYHNKVKMIYIDPPYNTGGDFVYPDDYADNLENYKRITGQVDEGGRRIGTNTESDGRYHSNWLNMMYPRLRLARSLLRDDGVIFISIDDNEVENLKKVCNEIFGEDNFIGDIIWEKRFTRNNDAKLMSSVIDHNLFYRKSEAIALIREPRTEKANSIYSNPDNDQRGAWTSVSYVSQRTKEQRPNLSYEIINPITKKVIVHPVNAWKYSKEKYENLVAENRLYWGKSGENSYPRLKRFLSELNDGMVPVNLWAYKDVGTLDDGTKEVDGLLGKDVFDYPKPASLIMKMTQIGGNSEDAIILDFFSGSGTTAHAVMRLNAEDGGNRRFIVAQLPEPTDEKSEAYKAGYKNICEIGKERIRRAGEQLLEEGVPKTTTERLSEDVSQPTFTDDGMIEYESKSEYVTKVETITAPGLDVGFKVFKLDSSNLRKWNTTAVQLDENGNPVFDPEQMALDLENAVSNYMPGRSELDVVYEIALKLGLDLTYPVEQHTIAGKNVYTIGFGALMICLDDAITKEVAADMIVLKNELKPETWTVVFKDNGFASDADKANICETLKLAGLNEEDFTTV